MKRLLYAVLLVSLLSACQPVVPPVVRAASEPAAGGAEDTAAIMTLLSETYGARVMAGDAAGYAELYSEDVLWAPPNGPDQTSKEGIRNGIKGLFDKFEFQVNPQPEEVVIQGDFAYVIGTVDGVLTPRAGGDPITIKFRIFWLLQRESGVWKISRQIWNNKPVDIAGILPAPQAADAESAPAEVSVEEKIQNALSAGPAEISQEAAILDYPEGWPGNWPNEPAPEYVELRPGSNGWSCITDNPTTPGNDPMCLNETQLAMVQARNALIDPPSTGFGVGYMLQGGGPVGSPPHIMIYSPGGREDLIALSKEMNPVTWADGWNMYADTPYAHLMIAAPPQPEAVSVEVDKIANAMSAGPAVIAEAAAILDYPEGWPGNWPNESAEEYAELRAGSNGWACIVDNPTTPGNDPMCLNETQLAMVQARNALIDPPSTGYGVGYMLQGGGPVGSPPHIMVFTPGSREDLTALSTDMNPITWATGWAMYPETPYVHLMVGVPEVP